MPYERLADDPGIKPNGVIGSYSGHNENAVPSEMDRISTPVRPGTYYGKDNRTSGNTPESNEPYDRSQVFGMDENTERGNWTGKLDFLLSMLGYAVGLGNIWRFPYKCYKNGGGAFLVPYLIMMSVVGIPLFYMEVIIGQYSSRGPITCWAFAPLFQGIGVAMLVCSALASIYYNMIIAWAEFFLFSSFTSSLPWSSCNNTWNTPNCSLNYPIVSCQNDTEYANGTCYENNNFLGIYNDTIFTEETGIKRVWPTEEYWNGRVLGVSEGIDHLGAPRWDLVLCLLLAWVIAFLCLIKGIKSTGKVVYFTAIFPYVILVILFFRGVTLSGAGEGVLFYIVPKWHMLKDARVWSDAAIQIFYSMGPAWGGLITLSSYNRFHNNALRDSMIVSLANCATSIFGGFVIFSFLGHMASELKVEVDEVAKDGAGLAFIVYPAAVLTLPGSTFWAILFFLMLILLGIDSQFTTIETLLTSILDLFPHLRSKKTFVILAICSIEFLLGLPLTTGGGVFLLELMDTYAAGWALLVIGLCEVLVVTYVYGVFRFIKDIEIMLGKKHTIFWLVCWTVLCPSLIVFILIFSWVDYSPMTYGGYDYPVSSDVMGWFMSFASITWIPIVMIYKIIKVKGPYSLLKKIRILGTPSTEWGPALVKHRQLVDYVPGFVVDPGKERALQCFTNTSQNVLTTDILKMNDSDSAVEFRALPRLVIDDEDPSNPESLV